MVETTVSSKKYADMEAHVASLKEKLTYSETQVAQLKSNYSAFKNIQSQSRANADMV